ncbi:amidoligase family protein [Lysinibacillus telephonicus]|uniref:amidoligase family protein n=1 Tax=Lysinibacillus telephonicus TaxID=1714840 RepID=UPI0031FE38FC
MRCRENSKNIGWQHSVFFIAILCIFILQNTGGIHINASTGFHVHVGAEKLNANNLRNLCNMIYSKQYLLEKALLYTPRKEYCNNFSKGFIEELNQKKPKDFEEFAEVWYGMPNVWKSVTNRYHDSKYKIINLHPLLSGRMETVEFRLFNGVLDEKELKAYIQFCTLIMAQTLKQKKVFYKPCIPFNEKYTFRIWLLKMGAIGDEFKDMRSILLRNLEGNIAWKYAPNFLKEEVYINQVHSNNDSYSNVDETDEYIDIF